MGSTSVIAPPPPVAGAPADEVVAYFTSHHVSLEIESVTLSVGMILLLIFAASLHALVGTTPSLTALAAATVMAACTLVEVAAFEALVYRPNPDAARATLLNDLQDFAFQITTFPALLFLAASSYAIVTTRVLPRILGQAAAIAATLQVVAWISFFAPSGPLAAGGIPSIVAFAALTIWIAACSLTMVARPGVQRQALQVPN
jgi:hypothetical protein